MLTIDRNGKWQIYWGGVPLPTGAKALGTVSRGGGDTGALLLHPTGIYSQGNAGSIRSLPQVDVPAALRTEG